MKNEKHVTKHPQNFDAGRNVNKCARKYAKPHNSESSNTTRRVYWGWGGLPSYPASILRWKRTEFLSFHKQGETDKPGGKVHGIPIREEGRVGSLWV